MSVFTVSRIGRTVLVGLGLAATTPLSWWIGGLVPDEVRPQDNPDYMWHPIKLSSGVETAIGLGSMVIVGVAILRIYRAIRRHTLPLEWFVAVSAIFARRLRARD